MRFLNLFFVLLASLLAAAALAVDTTAGPYRLSVVTEPDPVPVGRATLKIKITDEAGKPVEGAQVRAIARMPGMPMGEKEQPGQPVPGEAGTYTAPTVFGMEGLYEVEVNVTGPQGNGKGVVEMTPGKPSGDAGGGKFTVVPILIGLGVLGLAIFVILRMRKTGQSVDPRPIFTLPVIGSLLILAAAILLVRYAVLNWRRPGAMDPIEAQIMDMSAPAPEGTTAVSLATAELKPIAATVTYTGQAVGYVETDVVPRVSGTIVWMPYYVGQQVKKGQLLARLDTSQTEPEVAMRSAGVNTAQQEVSVATSEYNMALDMVSEARAEVSMARSDVAEAEAMLEAAKQGRNTAAAEVASAQAEVQAMQADLQSAQAENEYMQADLKRMQQLHSQGAVSGDEFQKAQADANKAAAMVRGAREQVRKAESMVRSARAMAKKVESEIAAAQKKVQQAQAGLRAKQAQVRRAQSGAEAARQGIGKARAMVQESVAGLKGATTQRGYSELRAQTDGVITQRQISPGQTVSPGQAVLKVAQINPIRLQANVPEGDLARIEVGARVSITHRGRDEQPAVARVTSVSPSLDAQARTGIVEAVLANPSRRFLPGQFVTMSITVGEQATDLTIPVAAVQQDVVPGQGTISTGTQAFVWTASPIENLAGQYTVSRTPVELGDVMGDLVAVREGLRPGQQVVVQGSGNLRAGQTVVSTAAARETQTVTVTNAGFDPPTISLAAGKATTVTFVRTEEGGCGEEVVFPTLNIRKELPLNEPVPIEIPAQKEGSLTFTCGMDMLRGKVVVR
ncbi:MAG TPA: efflux RND transporter periplasmic adaptor subunit [Fimbriimonas sp.]